MPGTTEDPDEIVLAEVVSTVAERWNELPATFRSRWPDVVGEVGQLVEAMSGGPASTRALAVLRLGRIVGCNPGLAAALSEITGSTRGDRVRPATPARALWPAAVALITSRLRDEGARRRIQLAVPPAIQLGTRAPFTVDLPRSPEANRLDPGFSPASTTYGVRVHVSPSLLRVDGPARYDLTVPADGDGPALAFPVVGIAVGTAEVVVDVECDGVSVGTVPVSLDVVEPPGSPSAPDEPEVRHGQVDVRPPRMAAADIELRIRVDDRGRSPELIFELSSPGPDGYHADAVGTRRLQDDPEDYCRWVLRELERSADHSRQRQLGERLWRDLVPDVLRLRYTEIRDAASLQITSDEPWIPWEVVRPFEHVRGRVVVDDDHLCARFSLARWLTGSHGAPDEVRVASFAVVDGSGESSGFDRFGWDKADARTPEDEDASSHHEPSPIVRERRAITELLRRADLHDRSPDRTDGPTVRSLIAEEAGHVGLWHMLGHGDGRGVELTDGSRLDPHEVAGGTEVALAYRRPLVVLNVCRSVQQDLGPGGLSGWAAALVHGCGTPLVGTQWSVTDDVAAEVIVTFYRSLLRGETVGAAMSRARRDAREQRPDDASWLAYAVYAHPNTRVRLGS